MNPNRLLTASLIFGSVACTQGAFAAATRPDTLTMVATGTITRGEDSLDLFGGGDLAGLTYTATYNLVFTYPGYSSFSGPYGYLSQLNSVGTDTIETNGHTFVINGEATAYNAYFLSSSEAAFDERWASIEGSNPGFSGLSDQDLADRVPSQWAGDPAAAYVFQNSTVEANSTEPRNPSYFFASTGYGYGLVDTYAYFDVTSISSTFTTIAIPEPATWTTMLLGFSLTGWLVRRRRLIQSRRIRLHA
jgi:hypothetical protein